MPQVQPVDLYKGENRTFTLYARNASNNVQTLTGATLTWYVGRPPNNPGQDQNVFTGSGTIVSTVAGTYTMVVTPGNTSNLTPGNYQYLTDMTDTNGNVTVVTVGRFTLKPYITA